MAPFAWVKITVFANVFRGALTLRNDILIKSSGIFAVHGEDPPAGACSYAQKAPDVGPFALKLPHDEARTVTSGACAESLDGLPWIFDRDRGSYVLFRSAGP
jgi:hypothetical protein